MGKFKRRFGVRASQPSGWLIRHLDKPSCRNRSQLCLRVGLCTGGKQRRVYVQLNYHLTLSIVLDNLCLGGIGQNVRIAR